MIYSIGTDWKKETIAFDGRLMGRAVCEPGTPFDLNLGIATAIFNTYIYLPAKHHYEMEHFDHYYIIHIPSAYMLEVVATVAGDLLFDNDGNDARHQWAPHLAMKFLSYSHSYQAMTKDMDRILAGTPI
jgi:hypothetical protein